MVASASGREGCGTGGQHIREPVAKDRSYHAMSCHWQSCHARRTRLAGGLSSRFSRMTVLVQYIDARLTPRSWEARMGSMCFSAALQRSRSYTRSAAVRVVIHMRQ